MFLIFYVVYPTYNILYLINLNKKSVTHIWATAPAKVYHIDMDDVAIDVLINSDKDVIRTWVTGSPRKYTRHIDMDDVATNVLTSSFIACEVGAVKA